MNAVELRTFLCERFNETELRTLVFDLKIPFEDLGGAEIGKDGRVQALIEWCVRRERVDELSEAARRARTVAAPAFNGAPVIGMNDWAQGSQFDRVMRNMDNMREDVAELVTKVEVNNQRLAQVEERLRRLEDYGRNAEPVSLQQWVVAVIGLIMAVVLVLAILQLMTGGR